MNTTFVGYAGRGVDDDDGDGVTVRVNDGVRVRDFGTESPMTNAGAALGDGVTARPGDVTTAAMRAIKNNRGRELRDGMAFRHHSSEHGQRSGRPRAQLQHWLAL